MKLWQKSIISMALGTVLGFILKESSCVLSINTYDSMISIMVPLLKIFASLYMNSLRMIIVPIVILAVLFGIISIGNINDFKKIGGKALIICITSAFVSVCTGLLIASIVNPGKDVKLGIHSNINTNKLTIQNETNVTDLIENIIPSNPFESMRSGNTLQLVVFSFFLGISILLVPEDKSKKTKEVIMSISHVFFKMVEIIMKATPYGIFAVMSSIVMKYGINIVGDLGKLFLTVIGGFIVQYIIFGAMLAMVKLNPIPFFKKFIEIQTLAFSTSSTKACLVQAIENLENKIGVSQRIARFVFPLSTSINMSAISIYLSISAIFFASAYGIHLSWWSYFIIVITATIGGIGGSGIPSGGVIMMALVFQSVGIPVDGIPILMGFDRILDMIRTVVNITGDSVLTVMIAKIENELDIKKYTSN